MSDDIKVVPTAAAIVLYRDGIVGIVLPDGDRWRWFPRLNSGAALDRDEAIRRVLDAMALNAPHAFPALAEVCRADGHDGERLEEISFGSEHRGVRMRCARCAQTWIEYFDGSALQ